MLIKILGGLTSVIFILTFYRIFYTIVGFFCKSKTFALCRHVEWKPIVHDRAISISEIEGDGMPSEDSPVPLSKGIQR